MCNCRRYQPINIYVINRCHQRVVTGLPKPVHVETDNRRGYYPLVSYIGLRRDREQWELNHERCKCNCGCKQREVNHLKTSWRPKYQNEPKYRSILLGLA